ncbi:MAG: hypothetical protein HY941_01295, partial [Gammaproteobacteria bacterium]|nr:hypothetical protein [Gammaproteobacteria bacterium]
VTRIALSAADNNRLQGDAPALFEADTRMAVVLQLPDAETLELSYTPGSATGGVATSR